jgi:hypothetical protein
VRKTLSTLLASLKKEDIKAVVKTAFKNIFRRRGLPRRVLRISLTRPFRARVPRRAWVLVLGLVLIPLLHGRFALRADKLGPNLVGYRLNAATGLMYQEKLVYFLYYKGLYPLATTLPSPGQSRTEAERIIDQRGQTLVMEVGVPSSSQIRLGDHLRMYLYLVDALWKSSTADVKVRPANILAFVLALMGLYLSFWWVGRPLLGAGAVLLLSTHPAQLYELYVRENIFSWMITAATAALALCLPLMDSRGAPRPSRSFALAAVVGLFLGSVHHIRTEAALVVASALGVCLLAAHTRWRLRLALGATVVASFLMASGLWRAHFKARIAEAYALVKEKGGYPHPEAVNPQLHHKIWFPIWTGLADYAADRGFDWEDRTAHVRVKQRLKERYGIDLADWDTRHYHMPGKFIDEKKAYVQLPYSLPHYYEIIRDDVITHIKQDPLWYIGVLARRGHALLTQMAPVRVPLNDRYRLMFPCPWYLFPLTLLLAISSRNFFHAKLLAFTLPLSLPALLIYSGAGMLYTSTYYLFGLLVGTAMVLQVAFWWSKRFARGLARRQSAPVAAEVGQHAIQGRVEGHLGGG